MAKCDLCGKKVTFGKQITHFGLRNNRTWKPNIKKAKILINDRMCKVNACCKCLRTVRNKTV